jgi:hypothetical protein
MSIRWVARSGRLQKGNNVNAQQIEIATRIASAKRPSAKMITQIVGRKFVDSWIPRAGGLNVSHPSGKWRYETRAEAIDAARETIQNARRVLSAAQPNADGNG